ncbi:MAG TPA: hypothetical protein VK141_05695 [Nitrosomonas sp.]|nr:hypothetical protein [Nitrosomonas sp.]
MIKLSTNHRNWSFLVDIDLYQLAIDAGMTEEEFIVEISRQYAAHVSTVLEENPGRMLIYTINYPDHDVEITAKRLIEQLPPADASIN